ncbi:hypothetical protein SAMD00019534_032100 [Acytostelium subglobosum LB1]|uniref:hypothetical protein n=1 Tax=Acytostelium subglobosum LB1 TaxID=1410327 RepID=UPI000644CBDA|nr:hypothetical protein SAMD00019534_032100 [Acytostelium subglobosum LB1]GAM20035.1 hypothetical protein SAMD00019534_032100 [Acytostelium subglobosum LB1]|eukprot:XP_012756797.1 hypothetical protein SAMD00019534_032100 [Acytostelium subglobosum LB1]
MKNIFRKSVQIFHKKDKGDRGDKDRSDYSDTSSSRDSSRDGGSLKKEKEKKSRRKSKSYAGSDISASSDSPQNSLRGVGTGGHSPQSYSPMSTVNSTTSSQIFFSRPSSHKVFGVPLADVPCNEGSNVPIIVEKLAEHLELTSLSTEGLFRIPGRDVTILEFVRLFDNFEEVDVSSLEPYTAAGLLKRFFRDLPVFVPNQINKTVAGLFVASDGSRKKQIDMELIEKIRYLVHQLPPVHFEVMQCLTGLLSKLLQRSEENKMTVSNIAICLIPTLNCVPAIVTYPIQYHEYFFNEPFAEHHNPAMRPALNNYLTIEEAPELVNEMQKRYSRPASIIVSSTQQQQQQQQQQQPSTITSTTITSPHDSTPITFTVTTTYVDQQEQQQQQAAERARAKLAEDLQFQQFLNENQMLKNQYESANANGNSGGANNNRNSRMLRSVAFGSSDDRVDNNISGQQSPNLTSSGVFNNNITKANIQHLKEKIDRYSKEKMRELRESSSRRELPSSNLQTSSSSPLSAPDKDKLYRYSVDYDRFKDRYQKDKDTQDRRKSRDIGREIEREIEKRISPKERISILLNSSGGNAPTSGGRIGDRESRSFRYSISSQNSQYMSNANKYGPSSSNRDSGNYNRYSRDYRYSRELDADELLYLSRQRSQSMFDDQAASPSSSQSILLEQKLDKLRETINNVRTQRDNRTSRDYTMFIRDIDELRLSLQKETENSEFFAIKSLELVEKLHKEETKNQKLMEEMQLMESYFQLKEKLKRAKKQELRSRSPTMPISVTPPNGSTSPTTPPREIPLSSSTGSAPTALSKEQFVNQMLRGGGSSSRKLVNLVTQQPSPQ